MHRLTQDSATRRKNRREWSCRPGGRCWRTLCLIMLAGMLLLSACGGGATSNNSVPIPATLTGNWQFNMAEQINTDPSQPSFSGGLQGGFLLQDDNSANGTATGAAVYSTTLQPPPGTGGSATICNSGTAGTIQGTLTGRSVILNVTAGPQTFTFAGTLSLDGSTMAGSYTSTGSYNPADGSGCGIATTQAWSAIDVPPLTGPLTGSFHSTGGAAGLANLVFPVTGRLTQSANTGASSATVTGSLNFVNPTTNLSDYPCVAVASVSGQISGSSVVLQIQGTDGSSLGQIGQRVGSSGTSAINPVTLGSVPGGYALQDAAGPGYAVSSPDCPPQSSTIAGDSGNLCLALGNASACLQPVTLTPAVLTFPVQTLNTTSLQTITLTNISGTTLNDLTATVANSDGTANFSETDECGIEGAPSQGQPFYLAPTQSCGITIVFTPLESCAAGTPPSQCPSPLNATLSLTVTSLVGSGNNAVFTVPITGMAVSANAISAFKQDFRLLPPAQGRGRPAQAASSSKPTFRDLERHAEID